MTPGKPIQIILDDLINVVEEIKKIIEEWLQYNHIAYEFVLLKKSGM